MDSKREVTSQNLPKSNCHNNYHYRKKNKKTNLISINISLNNNKKEIFFSVCCYAIHSKTENIQFDLFENSV